MQKVFKSCYELDRKCYEEYHLTEDILMEHAASSMEEFIRRNFPLNSKVLIATGAGNNGADGITLARLLAKDYNLILFLALPPKSSMAKIQFKRLKALNAVEIIDNISLLKEIKADIIVDAIFGAGLNRELSSNIIEIVDLLNLKDSFKIACDIPTGIDENGRLNPIAFKSDTTITMGALKESLFLDEAKDYVGNIIVTNLGVARELYEDESNTFLLDKEDINLPIRKNQNVHKGSFGHSAIYVGEKKGAATISATAAFAFGSALVTLISKEPINHPPYLMIDSKLPTNTTAIAIGMGYGREKEIPKEILEKDIPTVIDADLFYNPQIKELLNKKVVLTPHPKEFASLWKIVFNKEITPSFVQKNRFNLVREFQEYYPNIVLLLKGANMIIGYQKKIYINSLGSSILAKGGSGDVLSGLITALLSQGYSLLDGTISASLALSLSGAKYKKASYSLFPTDLIEGVKELND